MPYKSKAQERFFHTDTAKKAGITEKEVNEFDEASKGKKLPEKVKKMADGGLVAPDWQDQLKQYLLSNVGQIGSAIPGPVGSAMGIARNAPQIPPADAMASEDNPKKDKTSQQLETESKVADSHPGHTAEDLQGYIQGQEQATDQYGADQQVQAMQSLLKGENGLGMNVAKAGAGLSDAIMQGVARAGEGNALKNINENEANANKTVGELGPALQGANLKQLAMKQALEQMNPGGPLHDAAVAPAIPLLMKMNGISEEKATQIANNSTPDALMKMLGPAADVYKAQMDETLRKAIEENTALYQQGMLGVRNQELKLQHPWLTGSVLPGSGGNNSFNHASIPKGQKYQAPDGTWRIKQ